MTHGLDSLQQYREIVSQIRAIKPKAELPEPTDIRALNAVRDILWNLQHPAPKPPTPSEKQWLDANALQTQISSQLADLVGRGIVTYEEFPFPDEDEPNRLIRLQSMQSRLHRAKDEHNLPAEVRVKRLEARMSALEARVGGLEQEIVAHDAA